jgi:NAD-specific glutamate dehydrogenase
VIAYASHGDALLNIVWAMRETTGRVERFAELYYKLEDLWSMRWLREQIEAAPDETIWAQIARSAALKDLDDYQRSIVKAVFAIKKGIGRAEFEQLQEVVDKRYGHVLDEWLRVVKQMQSLVQVDFAVFSVALLRLSKLAEVMNQDLAATMVSD